MAVKPLSAKDLKSYHEGMYEIDFILGETKILYYPLVSKSNSIYNENKRVLILLSRAFILIKKWAFVIRINIYLTIFRY